ncbi:putative lipoprotein [Streptomyces sp. F-3]|jgi:uncharacterized protein (DUF305 family)|uniref:DUF305 domain-containing protein n=1 Tax=Streptomyces thermogriseus TaxID=75292 RepID=A0ABP4DKJ4_9ACTN|nr:MULTISPECIES: DUF305 domain-containing protein [Streptomyces]MDN5381876.1 DUF305 domain-containing protein [Streptomyces sp. LB8]GAT80039.1 putative lipoprotein [Streptomyces sp. F-3]
MNSKRSLIRRAVAVAAAGAAAAVLAACGGGGDSATGHDGHPSKSPSASASASTAQGQHNAADVAFAKGMIPHHRQAVEMADLAPSRAQSAEVKKLAEDIKKAQDPEIKTMSGWLTSWGEQVPAEGAMDHSMHGMHGMKGMMSAEEMERLEKSSGKAFDTAFMELMIKHHEGAVAMAEEEQKNGAYQPAKDMADAIITSQTAEIRQMNELLGKN